jgi:uncharacterized protein YtpQ (UPF0354 family)
MKDKILDKVEDLVSDFLYDRKEDEDLPELAIEEAVKDGTITIEEIVAHFKKHLIEGL